MSNNQLNKEDSEDLELMNAMIPSLPSKEDYHWVSSNWKELTPFEGKWVAIYQKKIRGVGDDIEEAREKAHKEMKREVPNLYFTFVTPSHCVYPL